MHRSIAYGAVSNLSLEVVGLEVVVAPRLCLEYYLAVGEASLGFCVGVYLEVHTALDFTAHACELLRVHRYILYSGCAGAHRGEVRHPAGATKLLPTRADPAYASSLLSCANLLHLDAHMEGVSQYTDELSEVYTSVCDVVEDCLVAISLIFHVPDLHV